MRGRPPKDPAVRQRTNKIATEAELDAEPAPGFRAPPLRKALFNGAEIHPETRRWWRTIWRSPMAPRWIEADVLVLEMIARLRNEWNAAERPTATLAKEIAAQEQRVGLDLMGRKRFDWRITGPGQRPPAPAETTSTRSTPRTPSAADDPRNVLMADDVLAEAEEVLRK